MADQTVVQTAAHWAAWRAVRWVVQRAAWKAEPLADEKAASMVAYLAA